MSYGLNRIIESHAIDGPNSKLIEEIKSTLRLSFCEHEQGDVVHGRGDLKRKRTLDIIPKTLATIRLRKGIRLSKDNPLCMIYFAESVRTTKWNH